MPRYSFTPYFENEVLRKRPYLTKDMCIRVVESPVQVNYRKVIDFGFGGGP